MCGLFGWYQTTAGASVDLDYLTDIAVDTERRGPHAFGFAWLDQRGKLHSYKQPGRISDYRHALHKVADATAIIGHCRWTTRGSESDNSNNHPHRMGRHGYVVHNGKIPEYDVLLQRHRFDVQSQCDSEVLGHLYGSTKGPILRRVLRSVRCTRSDIAILALWPRRRRLAIYADGKPLSLHGAAGGVYLASLWQSLRGGKTVEQRLVSSICENKIGGLEVESLAV